MDLIPKFKKSYLIIWRNMELQWKTMNLSK
jgi:hypothetical protein